MADNNNELTPQQLAEACAAAMNERDLAVRHLGIKILRVAPGAADLQMTVSEIMIQGHASCHGGYLFTLADSAFAYACNSYDDVCVALGSASTTSPPAASATCSPRAPPKSAAAAAPATTTCASRTSTARCCRFRL